MCETQREVNSSTGEPSVVFCLLMSSLRDIPFRIRIWNCCRCTAIFMDAIPIGHSSCSNEWSVPKNVQKAKDSTGTGVRSAVHKSTSASRTHPIWISVRICWISNRIRTKLSQCRSRIYRSRFGCRGLPTFVYWINRFWMKCSHQCHTEAFHQTACFIRHCQLHIGRITIRSSVH